MQKNKKLSQEPGPGEITLRGDISKPDLTGERQPVEEDREELKRQKRIGPYKDEPADK